MNINYKTFKLKKLIQLILKRGYFQEMEQNSVCALFQVSFEENILFLFLSYKET